MLLKGTSHLHNSTPPIIHRDLKPANILCFDENGVIVLKIADFGISMLRRQDEDTYTDHTIGHFQAPEVIKWQKYSKSVDIWSLGVVLFFLTTGGEFPYFTEIEDWHQHQQPINYQDLWKFSNSFFQIDDTLEGVKDVINQMIVLKKRSRISIDVARRKIQSYYYNKILLTQDGRLRSLIVDFKTLLGKQTIREIVQGDDQIATTIRIILNYSCADIRERLGWDFPSELYQSLDSPEKISTYIRDTIQSGYSGLRKYRLFTVGHQGCGKSSLNHYIR